MAKLLKCRFFSVNKVHSFPDTLPKGSAITFSGIVKPIKLTSYDRESCKIFIERLYQYHFSGLINFHHNTYGNQNILPSTDDADIVTFADSGSLHITFQTTRGKNLGIMLAAELGIIDNKEAEVL